MSKDEDSKTRKIDNNSESTTAKGTTSSSTESLRFPSIPCMKSNIKFKENSPSSASTVSFKSENKHYIVNVQPQSASCSFTPLESDETVSVKENEDYASMLMKEMKILNNGGESDAGRSTACGGTTADGSKLEEECEKFEKNETNDTISDDVSLNSITKQTNKLCKKIASGPRLTTSDSFISINRKYFYDIGRKFVPPTEVEVRLWEKSNSSAKIQQKHLNKSENCGQTSSSTPISLYENEKYKCFTDSNSQDDETIESIKPLNGRKKPTTGKVEFKKGIELKNSSLLSVPSTVCRICHTNTVNERLLSPCYCKGSLAYVHLSCLERWLNQSSRSYCELCLYQYNAVETLRYGFFEGIRLWVRHPRNRNHVKSDCLIAILLTLVTLGLVVICFIGMDYFMIEGIKLGMSRMWTKSFIVSFLGVIVMGYVVTIYLIARDQFVPWYTWWKNTLNIRLLLSPTVMQTQRI